MVWRRGPSAGLTRGERSSRRCEDLSSWNICNLDQIKAALALRGSEHRLPIKNASSRSGGKYTSEREPLSLHRVNLLLIGQNGQIFVRENQALRSQRP